MAVPLTMVFMPLPRPYNSTNTSEATGLSPPISKASTPAGISVGIQRLAACTSQ